VAALRSIGLLAAPLPPGLGGCGLGTVPEGAAPLCAALRLIGRASLPLGRLYEGHVNALRLVLRHGSPRPTARWRKPPPMCSRRAVLRYRRGDRVLAVVTVDRDRESLRIEAAMEEGQATA
jgi:hypothetical protein